MFLNNSNVDLKEKSAWVWRETVAIHRRAPETRLASSLSSVEIFVALYYGGSMRLNPTYPLDPGRDRCVISKGHGSICMYPILADLGFFGMEELHRVCVSGGILGGIPDPIIPGYETINGSLGHGLGVGTGMALALARKNSDRNVFVVVGDGELHEGANWEAIMFASQHGLDNLHLIVDNNKISMLGFTEDIVTHGNLEDRLSAFGWDCTEVDGHDSVSISEKVSSLVKIKNNKPKALLCKTLKGHGVPGLENAPLSHIMNPKPELLDEILTGDDT